MLLIQIVTYNACFIKGFYMDRYKTPPLTLNQIRRTADTRLSTFYRLRWLFYLRVKCSR
jgi:hypothetical protein